ncbi:tetratricopeptide repeat protein [Neorhodopirellula pilleata]|nr:hypothetical protein [Neorhodopirellula pilleata]
MKPHHLWPDECVRLGRQYSYGIEDFLYAASYLGIIRRLIWVAPPHVPILDPQTAIAQLQQSDAITANDLKSLRLVSASSNMASWIEAKLYGLEILICRSESLPFLEIESDALVDIDIDYFVELPSEEIGSPVEATADLLMNLNLSFDEVTVSRSVHSGYTPHRHAVIAERLAHRFANAQANPDQPIRSDRHDDRDDPLRLACRHSARGMSVNRESLAGLVANHQELLDNLQNPKTGLLHAAIGLLACQIDDLDVAITSYFAAREVLGGHPELALEIAKLCLRFARWDEAEQYFRDAFADDKTRTAAHYYLGYLHVRRSVETPDAARLKTAREQLLAAHQAAPVWPEVMALLAQVETMLGDSAAAGRRQEELRALEQIHCDILEQMKAGDHG